MKIKISLNEKSIKNALEKVKKCQKDLPLMKFELLKMCAEQVKNIANRNLESWDIGDNVKAGILSSWETIETQNRIILTNRHEKAVYVEFGTGIVGEQSPHPNALEENYEYNKESVYKDSQGRWTFYKNLKDLDLPTEYSDDRIYFNEPRRNSERMLVRTSGAPASMFVFNAIMEIKQTEFAKKAWQEIKKRYWG